MWICGAHGPHLKEAGILEEIQLANCHRNPYSNYSIWDSVLYEKVAFCPNLTVMLNSTCTDALCANGQIEAIEVWQMTTQTRSTIEAKIFVDCSGDSILAPLTGAFYRWGRESQDEFGEDIQPTAADGKTRGNSLLLQIRRYVGPQILTQNDVAAGGRFDDIVAYGGWSMDDHHPGGLLYPGQSTLFHPAPSPYGIPFGSLYSANVSNLMFAGRNISVTHAALSSTRVMGTTSLLGQAAGTAAALCSLRHCSPSELHANHMRQLQKNLMDDDCWLPGYTRESSPWTNEDAGAKSRGST